MVVGPFAALWLCTNYAYLRALGIINPADVTALFSSAPAFVFLFSCLFLGEPFLLLPLAAVCFAIVGIVLFSYAEGFKGATAEGVVLSVGAAIGAGLYKTLYKRVVGNASLGQVALFLSLLGIINLLLVWPVPVSLALTHTEKLTSIPWGFLTSNAALSLLFNFFINFGIAITYPLFISLGTVLGIPLNALADYLFRHDAFSAWKIVSTEFILVGFVMLLLPRSASLRIQEIAKSLCPCLPKPSQRSEDEEALVNE